jgi:hypothetical protein
MGAGARLAEERDRWEDHWRLVDLEQEGEHLLDVLSPAEELRTAVPGLRVAADVEWPVLIGITDRRVLVVSRTSVAESGGGSGLRTTVSVDDVTAESAGFARGAVMPVADGGSIAFDLDERALDRLWSAMDGLAGTTGVGCAADAAGAG